jgi:hypothetical protein
MGTDGPSVHLVATPDILISSGVPIELIKLILRSHQSIVRTVRERMVHAHGDELARVATDGSGDVSYEIDLPAESVIDEAFSAAPTPVTVICEGTGIRRYPHGSSADVSAFRILIDPLDGTRELMLDKRSAFILTGVAPDKGDDTTLDDVTFGLATEVPPTIQSVAVQAWAARGAGSFERRFDVETGETVGGPRRLRTSSASSVRGGYANFVAYFPGTYGPVGSLADSVLRRVLGEPEPGKAAAFDDSYISTGGQLYLLASGRYRSVVDLRPEFDHGRAGLRSLCAHPYDLAGVALIAAEAGASVVDLDGGPLRYPMDTDTNCSFAAYANEAIRAEVEPHLRAELETLRAGRRGPGAEAH